MHASGTNAFSPFSPTHAVVVGVIAIGIVSICVLGRRLRQSIGVVGLAVLVAHQAYWLMPSNFTWSRSLPLHLCDLAGIIAPIAMFRDARWARTLLYYWAVCLCSQGLVTPVLTEGPGTMIFWLFFGSHAMIVGSAVFDVCVGGYVPGWRDWRFACLATLGYLAGAFVLDLITGWNYGYAGAGNASQATVINLLGPWPWRVLTMAAIGVAAFALATVPWTASGQQGVDFRAP